MPEEIITYGCLSVTAVRLMTKPGKKSLIVILDDWLNNLKPVWQAAVATGMKIRQSPVRNPPEKDISPQTA